MQDAVLFAEKVDHGLQQAEQHKGKNRLPLQVKVIPPEWDQQAHQQPRQQKTVAEQHDDRGGVQCYAGAQEAEAPEGIAGQGCQNAQG